jgi:hypothetical protein
MVLIGVGFVGKLLVVIRCMSIPVYKPPLCLKKELAKIKESTLKMGGF